MAPDIRGELLLAFHILDLFGQNSGIAGHLTVRAGSPDEALYAHGYGQGFDEVRGGDIHLADFALITLNGPSRVSPSLTIHTELYRARPDVHCVIHTHSLAAVALSATGADLVPLYQSSLIFAGDCPTMRSYGGIVETPESGRELAAALGPNRALILANHGTLVVGRNIREAVHSVLMLEDACRIQLQAMSAAPGKPLLSVSQAEADEAKRFLLTDKVLGLRWDYYVRRALAAKPWLADDLANLAATSRMAAE